MHTWLRKTLQNIVEQSPDDFCGLGKLWIDVAVHLLRRLQLLRLWRREALTSDKPRECNAQDERAAPALKPIATHYWLPNQGGFPERRIYVTHRLRFYWRPADFVPTVFRIPRLRNCRSL